MAKEESVKNLDDRQVTLALQHLGWDLQPSSAEINGFADHEEGRRLVHAFMDFVEAPEQDDPLGDAAGADGARNALRLAMAMPETTELANELVEDPPDDDQMSLGDLPQYVALVGFVVAFLQVRFNVHVSRHEGQTEFDFKAGKEPLDNEQLGQFISLASTIVSSPPDK